MNLQSSFNKKRLSVQTPFEDAIFLEDKALSDINDTPSPAKNNESFSDLGDSKNISEMVDQVDQLNKKTIIKKVFDFSKESKNSEEVVSFIFLFNYRHPLALFADFCFRILSV
jgi:hypothetical protein